MADSAAEKPKIAEGKITEEALERGCGAASGPITAPSFYGMGPLHEAATRDTHPPLRPGHWRPQSSLGRRRVRPEDPLGQDHRPADVPLQRLLDLRGAPAAFPASTASTPAMTGCGTGPSTSTTEITVQEQFTDLEEKKGEFAGRVFIQSSISTYRNQRGETIAECKGWQFRAERRAARERGKYQREPHRLHRGRDTRHRRPDVERGDSRRGPPFLGGRQRGRRDSLGGQGAPEHGRHRARSRAGCIGGLGARLCPARVPPPSRLGLPRPAHRRARSGDPRPRRIRHRGRGGAPHGLRLRLPAHVLARPSADQLDGRRRLPQAALRRGAPASTTLAIPRG